MTGKFESFSDILVFFSLQAVAHFDIATKIGDGTRTTSELAVLVDAQEDWIYRILRALAAEGFFEEVEHKTFRNTNLSERFRKDVVNSRYSMARFWGSFNLR